MRLTTNKPTIEMTILELACNCVYEKDGRFFYKNYNKEMPLTEFMEYLSDKLGGTLVTAGVNEDAVIDELWDNLMNPITNADGLIAFIFRSLAAIGELRKKLKVYEDLEEQGKLIKLPFAVGDTVYTLNKLQSGKTIIAETTTDSFFCALCTLEGRFGKTVFFTRQEAEQALCAKVEEN